LSPAGAEYSLKMFMSPFQGSTFQMPFPGLTGQMQDKRLPPFVVSQTEFCLEIRSF
jgi:hypothetical protein